MTGIESVANLRELLDEEWAIRLLQRSIAVESITGNEEAFASFLAEELEKLGAQSVQLRDFEPGRPNVWGVVEGAGGGKRLMLIGHTDTVHVEGWHERWAGTEREDPFGGAIVDGEIWGRGSGDLKAGICSALCALNLLKMAGTELAGDVQLAFIGDEESGEQGVGVSAGMKGLVPVIESGELDKPDFAVYLEPTNLEVYTAQIGFFIADIELSGKSAYFGVPELGKDALKAGNKVLKALWAHSDDLSRRGEHQLVGKSFLLVTEVTAGGYIAVPGECRISLIRKLRPGEDLYSAAEELERVVRGAVSDPEIYVDVQFPAGRDNRYGGTATEVDPRHEAVTKLIAAANEAAPGRARIAGAPYWSEAPFLTNLGVPTIYFAPGDIRNCHTLEERVNLADYTSGIVALAAFIADYCGAVRSSQK
jgi:acetylornithine deacetylase